MTTLKDHERRITALEENQRATTESLYKLRRFRAETKLRLAKMMRRLDLEDISEDEIDEFLDQE